MAHDIQQTVTHYLAAWNETDATRRRVLLATLLSDDCEYIDPLASVSGHSGLDRLIESVQAQLPGFEFSLAGKLDHHHEQARFTWQAAPKGAAVPVVIGFDVLVFESDRIRRVYGFIDKAPG